MIHSIKKSCWIFCAIWTDVAGVNPQGVNPVAGIYTLLRKWPINQAGKSINQMQIQQFWLLYTMDAVGLKS